MTEKNAREAVPTSPNAFLAAPSGNQFEQCPRRSASLTPSRRSSQSRRTVVQETEADPEFMKTLESRQQTFKIRQKLSRWMFLKGFINPKKGMKLLADLVEVQQLDVPDDRMFDREKSPFNKDVWVSPKHNSSDYHKALCLLDTGCFQTNIVSKQLIEKLGYTEADYEPLGETESSGSTTLSGELITFDGVIRLSWHHNTSTHRYHRMRFLVSSSTNCEMIIGVRSITKYHLLREMVLVTEPAAINVQADPALGALKTELARLQSSIENYKAGIKKQQDLSEPERDAKLLAKYEKQLKKRQHEHHVQELKTDAREAEINKQWQLAKTLKEEADNEVTLWNHKHQKKHAKSSPTGASARQPGPKPVVSARRPSGSQGRAA